MNAKETQILINWGSWIFLLSVLISGCQTAPVREPPSGIEPDSVVELDENTDPRFVSRTREGFIGRISIDGQQVFLNNQQLTRSASVPNGAVIRTGGNSGARVALKTYNKCRYFIEDFRKGRIYGNTDACGHSVVMDYATGQSTQTQTRYVMEAEEDRAVVTLIAGKMRLALLRNPGERIVLTAFQEARVTPTGLVGPLPVDATTIRERLRWRSSFKFDKPSPSKPPDDANFGFIAPLIWELFQHRDDRHNGSKPTPNDPGHSPTTGGSGPSPSGPGTPTHQTPKPVLVSVPNLRGKSVSKARAILRNSGLKIQIKPSGSGADYWVVSQTPAAGKRVPKGSVIRISVSAPIK